MYDYIVIGAGSAGAALASRLSEDPNVQVCLLEAGGPDDSVLIHCPAGLALMTRMRSINWGFETVPQPGLDGRRGYQPRGRVLGGSSSINAMIYIRGQRQDYDAWAAAGGAEGLSLVEVGKKAFDDQGCSACHAVEKPEGQDDGIGPSLFGKWGGTEQLAGGASVKFDENYVRESIVKPSNR